MSDVAGPLSGAEVAALIEGRSDDEVASAVAAKGTDDLLRRAFDSLAGGFAPERAPGASAVIQWDLGTAEGTRSWQLEVEDDRARVAPGSAAVPRVTLALGVADFLRFVAGRLDGMQAFMSGRLRVSGDLMLAQAMQAWFSPAAAAAPPGGEPGPVGEPGPGGGGEPG